MSYKGENILAVVPARGGSKGVPRKNLAMLGGKTLVAHVAGLINELSWLDGAIISTDDPEIAEEGRKHGLDVPCLRPAELASDHSTAIDTWIHAWNAAEEFYHTSFEISIFLEPTSPCRIPEDISLALETLLAGGFNAAATVSRTPAHFTPHKTLIVEENGLIKTYIPDGEAYSIRQKIPPYYHRNGVAYVIRKECLFGKKTILGDNCAAVIIERNLVNIDTQLDIDFAEFLLQKKEIKLGVKV